MDWTKDRPTVEGFYWWRRNKYKATCMYSVFAYHGSEVLLVRRHLGSTPCDPEPMLTDGEWHGPLKPPE